MINLFRDKYRFLSNFYVISVIIDGEEYMSSEHAYQAAKTICDEDRKLIQNQISPRMSKRVGSLINKRKDWDDVKYDIMLNIVREKFTQNSFIKNKLLETGSEELVEGNTWCDQDWGNCTCDKCDEDGKNWLGKILMIVRSEL